MIESSAFISEIFRELISNVIIIGILFLVINKYLLKLHDFGFIHSIIKWIILFMALSYCLELVIAFFNGEIQKQTIFYERLFGEYFWGYGIMIFMNSIFPLLLFFKKLGNSLLFLLIVISGMNIGRIFEFIIIMITNFHKDFS